MAVYTVTDSLTALLQSVVKQIHKGKCCPAAAWPTTTSEPAPVPNVGWGEEKLNFTVPTRTKKTMAHTSFQTNLVNFSISALGGTCLPPPPPRDVFLDYVQHVQVLADARTLLE